MNRPTIHIHNYMTRDAGFEESKHPRANNGQFGAGAGKSHLEHAAHHANEANEHEKKNAAFKARNNPQLYEAVRHHREAAGNHLSAHEAQEAAKAGGKIAQRKADALSDNAHHKSALAHASGISASSQRQAYTKKLEEKRAAREVSEKANTK